MKKKKFNPRKQSRWKLSKPLYLKINDKRYKKYAKQIKTRGFSGEETWNLDLVIAEFILPRLIEFRKTQAGIPGCFMDKNYEELSKKEQKLDDKKSKKEWNDCVDKMIIAFDIITKGTVFSEGAKVDEGLDLFRKYFFALWS
jgi:hypothetical protein